MNQSEAAEVFLTHVIARARDGVVEDMLRRLSDAPSSNTDVDAAARAVWFAGLGDEARGHIAAIVKESVDAAVFGVMTVLDGVSGGSPINGVVSDFALSLQTYASRESRRENSPETSVRINARSSEYLHDCFRWKVEET